jgi:hypothetical protein
MKIGRKVILVVRYSVLDNSTSNEEGSRLSVLDAIVVRAPFSLRRIDWPVTE